MRRIVFLAQALPAPNTTPDSGALNALSLEILVAVTVVAAVVEFVSWLRRH